MEGKMSNAKERVQKFCDEWSVDRWASDKIYSLHDGVPGREAVLTVTDVQAVLEENAELLRQLEAAAAPELLEALKKAETLLNHMGDILNGLDAVTAEDVAMAAPIFEAVRAAIAKAEGTGK
jgi:hypothetical protein